MIIFKLFRYLIPFVFFLIVFLFLWRGLNIDPHTIPSPLINQKVPIFNLPSVEQPSVRFTNKTLQGHVSLVNVWATWCTTCRAEHPFLMDLAQSGKIAIYGIDYKDDLQEVRRYLQVYGNPYRVLGFDNDGKISIDLGVYGTPETFLIDQHGVIRYKLVGELTPEVWERKLLPVVKRLQR